MPKVHSSADRLTGFMPLQFSRPDLRIYRPADQVGKAQNIINSCAIQKGQADEYIYMDSPESAFVLGISLLADPESFCYLLLGEAVQFPQAYDPFENAGRTAKISSG